MPFKEKLSAQSFQLVLKYIYKKQQNTLGLINI